MFFIPYGTRENRPRRTFPYVTLLLVLINVVVFGYEAYLVATQGEPGITEFLNRYAVVPAKLIAEGWLQTGLLTSMFLHAGFLHIIGNMLYLLPFGDNVEDRLGHFRYLLFYILCGLIATITYVLFNKGSDIPLLGASGAVAGVLGGYLMLFGRGIVKGFLLIIIILIRIDLPAWLFIGYWFIMQLFSSVASFTGGEASASGVAFLAHVGGFAAGLLLAPLMARKIPAAAPAVAASRL